MYFANFFIPFRNFLRIFWFGLGKLPFCFHEIGCYDFREELCYTEKDFIK